MVAPHVWFDEENEDATCFVTSSTLSLHSPRVRGEASLQLVGAFAQSVCACS